MTTLITIGLQILATVIEAAVKGWRAGGMSSVPVNTPVAAAEAVTRQVDARKAQAAIAKDGL